MGLFSSSRNKNAVEIDDSEFINTFAKAYPKVPRWQIKVIKKDEDYAILDVILNAEKPEHYFFVVRNNIVSEVFLDAKSATYAAKRGEY